MNSISPEKSKSIILADTNVAYSLFFFVEKGLIPLTEIKLNSDLLIEFHPIVLEEVDAHLEAMILCEEYSIEGSGYPTFFSTVGKEVILRLHKFIEDNTTTKVPVVDIHSQKFFNKRKIYEVERKRLQSEWKKYGTKGNKVTSTPSNKDYSILYSAECYGHKILTNDEILLSVAQEFLEEENTYKAEDIINSFYCKDKSLKSDITEVTENLKYLQISFSLARALK